MKSKFRRNPIYVNHVQSLIDSLLNSIKEYENKYFHKWTSKLVKENHELGGHRDAYYYRGILFHVNPRHWFRDDVIPPIHQSLEPAAEDLLDTKEELESQLRSIRHAFSLVARKAHSRQDMRDILPDALVIDIPELKDLSRTREEGFLFEPGTQHRKQFDHAVDLCLSLQAHRLYYT